MSFLFVGLGGALGAICRYSLSLITIKADFPLMTFITNLLGAFFIGLIAGFASKNKSVSPSLILFLKTFIKAKLFKIILITLWKY